MGRSSFPRLASLLCLWVAALPFPLAQATEASTWPTLDQTVAALSETATGKALLERARIFWKEERLQDVTKHLEFGPVSRTDAVLTRFFNPQTGEERRERAVTVILRRTQPIHEIALDLAHELTHAIHPPSWDPYDPALTAGRYVFAALESAGGEVEAVANECRASAELSASRGLDLSRCDRYTDSHGHVDRDKVQKDFYRVGDSVSFVKQRLGDESTKFPLLSEDAPALYSATGGAPYPVALIREYDELNRVACANVRKRLDADSGRTPASDTGQSLLNLRCGDDSLKRSSASATRR